MQNNINPMDIHTMLTSSLFAAPLFQSYGGQIAAGQYTDVKVPFSLGHKDIGLVNDIAVESGTPMPVAELLHQEFQEGISRGWGASVEWSALGLLQAERAGLSIDAMLPEHLRGSQAKGNQQ
jgi:3-hydroxyisobutyrate dehydrogenase-like beta-hydroxyacid dehydrogenase